jgi:hypothetical protein
MDIAVFESLLREGESVTLDFKRDQYVFSMRCVDVMGRRARSGSASPVRSCQTWTDGNLCSRPRPSARGRMALADRCEHGGRPT